MLSPLTSCRPWQIRTRRGPFWPPADVAARNRWQPGWLKRRNDLRRSADLNTAAAFGLHIAGGIRHGSRET
jgi:hypothetical protein